MRIWESYFLRRLLGVFFVVLIVFYGLYVFIDYAGQSASFHHHQVHFGWWELSLYYLCQLAYRADILVPFALLIATVQTLCDLNIHNELVALLASGVKQHRLLAPFLFFGLIMTLTLYFNAQFIAPHALQTIKTMEFQKKRASRLKKMKANNAQGIVLDDGSTLLYSRYDSDKNVFFDTYWMRSADDIYKIKFLHLNSPIPWGEYVDYMTRDADGNLVATTSARSLEFPTMRIDPTTLQEMTTQPEALSLTTLWNRIPPGGRCYSEKECDIATTFYYKMAMPWLCLLAVMGPAPWCVTFTRTLPTFFIYACSLFTLIAFYLVMEAALILGERQVLAPLAAILPPLLCFALPINYFYWRRGL